MKKIFLSLFILCISVRVDAQLQSPAQFLGYEPGERYTPHHRLVDYFQHVAQSRPAQVKLQQYGQTNERRPLYVAFISSQKNMANLESIRTNNLMRARILPGNPTSDATAIVWLSYNVHGNETSSSEAAMKTIFSLLDPSNSKAQQWLENTVVAIDPCLNPDGRDRYVNWYNSVIGKQWNPLPVAREHSEPWPGGRSNHYYYDLNRDWVWQTQVESRGRVALYNQWLPHVHVDFHEQSVNAPYYFAPAAEPYHEVITPWQREFQKTIGKNNARYFDEQGWLFFTGERFDLFYPSYGDTYPLYNGSIGMTYEQGGISAGLGILTNDKDTLTLTERILHHYTSGMSTIETASRHASKLVAEFKKYFDDALAGKVGEYRSYVIKFKPQDAQRIQALIKLLDQNGIRYGSGSGSAKGYDYGAKKEQSFTIEKNDLLIPADQPKAALVKVLFEPSSKLVDSLTYDITAWAMPYAYGLTAYASKQKFAMQEYPAAQTVANNVQEDVYAYAFKWQGLRSANLASQLLKQDVRIRYSEVPFESGGEKFDRGTIIINKSGNAGLGKEIWKKLAKAADENGIKLYPLTSGMVDKGADFGSDLVKVIKPAKVALLTGETVSSISTGQIWDYFENQIHYPLTLVNTKDFNRMKLADFDVLILPAGYFELLTEKSSSSALEGWIRGGGKLIAFGGTVSQLAKQDWSAMKLKTDSADKKKDTATDPYRDIRIFEDRYRDQISDYIPGAIFKVNVDNTHPLMFGYPDYYYSLKLDPSVYEFIKEGGWNVGYLKKENHMSGSVGYRLIPKLKDGLIFGVQDLGRGSIVYLTDDVIFRNFWETGKLMLANAVFFVGNN